MLHANSVGSDAATQPKQVLLHMCTQPEPEPEPEPMDEGEAPEKARKAEAQQEKEKGNAAYKARKFADAIRHYDRAAELDPNDISFLTNRCVHGKGAAAVTYLAAQATVQCGLSVQSIDANMPLRPAQCIAAARLQHILCACACESLQQSKPVYLASDPVDLQLHCLSVVLLHARCAAHAMQ